MAKWLARHEKWITVGIALTAMALVPIISVWWVKNHPVPLPVPSPVATTTPVAEPTFSPCVPVPTAVPSPPQAGVGKG